jgi:Holliday junction resolvase RusA-like endonuclease
MKLREGGGGEMEMDGEMIFQTFTIQGEPMGQQRPRFKRMGNFVKTYDPPESKAYKAKVIKVARAAGVRQMIGPVRLDINAYLPRPKRLCRKIDPLGAIPVESATPDWDNIGKIVSDALSNGLAYKDDSQVWHGTVRKWYHAKGDMPRVEVSISGERVSL